VSCNIIQDEANVVIEPDNNKICKCQENKDKVKQQSLTITLQMFDQALQEQIAVEGQSLWIVTVK
jgi:virulence-associated protein VagC